MVVVGEENYFLRKKVLDLAVDKELTVFSIWLTEKD